MKRYALGSFTCNSPHNSTNLRRKIVAISNHHDLSAIDELNRMIEFYLLNNYVPDSDLAAPMDLTSNLYQDMYNDSEMDTCDKCKVEFLEEFDKFFENELLIQGDG